MPKKTHPSVRLLDAFLLLSVLVIPAAAWEVRHAVPLGALIALPLAGIGAILFALYVVHAPDRKSKHR